MEDTLPDITSALDALPVEQALPIYAALDFIAGMIDGTPALLNFTTEYGEWSLRHIRTMAANLKLTYGA